MANSPAPPSCDWPAELLQRCSGIRLAVFDVDGVMTDGRLYRSDSGDEIKAFHSRDGLGLKALMRHGIEVGVITARRSKLVELRIAELGITHLMQGREDKPHAFEQLAGELEIALRHAAFMGDDLVDWAAMRRAGLTLCPADADEWLRAQADYVTSAPGGRGAVREAAELLLAGHGALDSWRESFQ